MHPKHPLASAHARFYFLKGYYEDSWNSDEDTDVNNLYWNLLSIEQQQAATGEFGCTIYQPQGWQTDCDVFLAFQ
jgi:hypothetical protein